MYAIVFTLNDSQFAYGSNSGTDTYPNGVAYFFVSSVWTPVGNTPSLPPDLAFRTYGSKRRDFRDCRLTNPGQLHRSVN